MDQRSSEWFDARCGKPTGSRFSDVMNLIAGGKPGANRRALITMLAVERLTTATLLVSDVAPPMPSIWRGSGVPIRRSSRSSRSAGSAGRPADSK